ncbi:Eco57I restriction-modification methylase domain-containing protein [Vibrio sp. Isolate22]|uniref:Eco57I restriction-modification methylase domain-containing protein n=1 Tax=Vibrio TaxID=662 RepID=UPI0010BE4296|nr:MULTISPECIES: TaqI-like C-terminal specificity domain-containing protein [Vibrio]MCG9692883.1 Eco57I restriction-modification methylase domain-containing protein [Vibrio sp. Isolate22]TKF00263.1 modification methylase PaeR7I [Vibrio kanaloae]TKF17810.1 modification methylase PaeR7I [Vibrio kanaloae]TKF78945.1 modification methylase PaeR7I [Vibrio kanaloae]
MQLAFLEIEKNLDSLTWGASDKEKGEVFTNPQIVSFMLKTSGVTNALNSKSTRILEPSCGQGEFVIEIAKLLVANLADTQEHYSVDFIKSLVQAFDISAENIAIAKQKTSEVLMQVLTDNEAYSIVESWFYHSDFLLTDFSTYFSHVIGNPPYVRIENIPPSLLSAYRSRYQTMKERADLYIAFYQKCLELLEAKGVLSFICTDRWTKNSYGSSLRRFISANYQLDLYVDLYGQSAFQSDVLTYPAITQLSRQKHNSTKILHNPEIDSDLSDTVYSVLTGQEKCSNKLTERRDIIDAEKPWLFGCADELNLIKRLEKDFPTMEDVGCKVYIGAATGNNKVYIVGDDAVLEPSRKVPLVTATDIRTGTLIPSGKFMVNTYDKNGVVELKYFPMLEEYLTQFREVLQKRHVAKKSPHHWFKTIDRVYPERAAQEKLLIPDIKSKLTTVYDSGQYHPNNSIYYICSSNWDLRSLQGVLISGIGQLFVENYSTKVAGGNLRFQAQHLRRICLPRWEHVDSDLAKALSKAAINNDIEKSIILTSKLYNLNKQERQLLG